MGILKIIHDVWKFFLQSFEVIFPKSAKQKRLEALTISDWKNMVSYGTHEGVSFFFLYEHKDIRDAIWEIKYRRNQKVRENILQTISEYILEELSEKMQFENFVEPIVTSIPQSRGRKTERGYNQSEDLALSLAKILKIPYSKTLLKLRDTKKQTNLKRAERLLNLKDSFGATEPEKILGKNIILIDDVVTTGSTLNEAKKTLLLAGANKVMCFAVAH